MDVSFTNSRTSIASARRADTDWASLTTEQRIRSIELDGYVVIPDLLSADQLDAIRGELSRLPTTAVDYSEHQRGCSNVQWTDSPTAIRVIALPAMIEFPTTLFDDGPGSQREKWIMHDLKTNWPRANQILAAGGRGMNSAKHVRERAIKPLIPTQDLLKEAPTMQQNSRCPFPVRLLPCMLVTVILSSSLDAPASDAGIPGKQPLYAFCGVGDNLWNHEVEPVDSPATIDAMFEWMSTSYGITRMYWREERIWDRSYKVGRVHQESYDWHANWKRHLINDVQIHEAAVAAARKHNMEIFFYFGLFEHGVQPDYVQPWWGHKIPGTGRIRMDWKTWVAEGIVDEFWVQLGETDDQKKTLDLLLKECRDKPINLTVRTAAPYAAHWTPYVKAGVTPVAVITWTNNGIERYSLEPTGADALKSPDWKLRAQSLNDVSAGRLKVDADLVIPSIKDTHVLVRRQAVSALATLGDQGFTPFIEEALFDKESSVRIAAAHALKRLSGPNTPQRMIDALQQDSRFQFKLLCSNTLGALQEQSLPVLLAEINSRKPAVREVCVRALYTLGKNGLLEQVYEPIRKVMLNPSEEYQNRCWAIDSLIGLRIEMDDRQKTQLLADLIGFLGNSTHSTTIQIHAATGLGYLAPLLMPEQQGNAAEHLRKLFMEYGDRCTRDDAAYGWRAVGNALLECGPAGRNSLDRMLDQTEDRWLAWVAYEVVYSVQRVASGFNLVEESEAIRNHAKYAPRFPGWRKW